MKFHLSGTGGRNAFTAYGAGYVAVNGVRHETSLLLLPEGPVRPWNVTAATQIDEAVVRELQGLRAVVLLIGTGATLQFPDRRLLVPLAQAGTGVEIMDTPAACRTFNILVGEGRQVAAALML